MNIVKQSSEGNPKHKEIHLGVPNTRRAIGEIESPVDKTQNVVLTVESNDNDQAITMNTGNLQEVIKESQPSPSNKHSNRQISNDQSK